MSVQAASANVDGHFVLKFTLKNVSGSVIHLNNGSVPWGVPGHVVVVGAMRWGDVLAPAAPPAPIEPVILAINLKPGEEIQGSLKLADRVKDIDKAVKKGQVVIFWWYEAWDDDKKSKVGEFGGWLTLPKSNT